MAEFFYDAEVKGRRETNGTRIKSDKSGFKSFGAKPVDYCLIRFDQIESDVYPRADFDLCFGCNLREVIRQE